VLLVALLLMGLIAAVAMALVAVLGARALRKRNRVSPSAASPAPAAWLGAPSASARLHRRLRSAVAVARSASAAAPVAPRLAELTADLEREAVAIDDHLVMVSRLASRERRKVLAQLATKVRQVEQLASQVSLMAVQAQAPMISAGQPSALDDLSHQLELLEQARHEVAQVESTTGVQRASPYATGRPVQGGRRAAPPSTPAPGT